MNAKTLYPIIALAVLVFPVTGAAINTIHAGNTVFIGEDSLDITAAVGSNDKIAYFITDSGSPDRIIPVGPSLTNFYVSPADFSQRTGPWYSWNENETKATADIAFYVDDPTLKIKVSDSDLDIDVTNKWLPRGDNAQFSIETNMAIMTERGVAGAPLKIKVVSPDGSTYSSLVNAAGTSQPLDVSASTSPYNPGIVWYSGDSQYAAGTYTVTVESDANNMKDNYPDAGRGVSAPVTVLVQTRNPLISTATTTVAVSATTVTAATTVPATTNPAPATTSVVASTSPSATSLETTATAPLTQATAVPPTTAPGFDPAVAVLAAGIALALLLALRR